MFPYIGVSGLAEEVKELRKKIEDLEKKLD
jgi:hypothetical protein